MPGSRSTDQIGDGAGEAGQVPAGAAPDVQQRPHPAVVAFQDREQMRRWYAFAGQLVVQLGAPVQQTRAGQVGQ